MSASSSKVALGRSQKVRKYQFPGLDGERTASAVGNPRQAFEQGFDQGIEQGRDKGFLDGREAGYLEGLQQGRQEGRQQGLQQGEAQGRARFELALVPLQAVMAQLSAWEQAQLPLQQQLLLNVVRQVAEQVVQRELRQTPDALAGLLDRLLATLPDGMSPLKIWLHPEDKAALEAVGLTHIDGWPLQAASSLQRGDCRLESEQASVESLCAERLSQAMNQVQTLLTGEA